MKGINKLYVLVVLLAGLLSATARTGLLATYPVRQSVVQVAQLDSVKNDPETGLAVDDQLMLVKAQCTACHSSKLILQSHFSRDKWIERIRWMQRTQKLWDLGESEPVILAYLVKHYGPIERPFDGRREPLNNIKWHKLETGR
jgi:hypothetical protein